jgi:predicted MFS family arabinose efflux permease
MNDVNTMGDAENDAKDASQKPSNAQQSDSLLDALLLALAIAVVNGFARFAYALLLPPMRSDLGWDYALSGWLNTANSIGYGVGALLGFVWALRFRPAQLYRWGLLGTLVTLLACAFTHDLAWMMVWRFLSGVGSAWVFACGGALVAARYAHDPANAGAAIALVYAGGGLGMALSGPMLYPVLSSDWHWSAGWATLAVTGLLLALPPLGVLRRLDAATPASTTDSKANAAQHALAPSGFWRMLLAYFLFGVGYIVYLTFVVAWLRDMRMGTVASVGVWVFLGAAVVASGWIWQVPMSRWWPGHTFAAASICVAVGTVLPLATPALWMLLLSALLVGSFFMVPGSVMAFTRAWLPQPLWSKCMNLFTVVFAAGQAVGPVVAGVLGDRYGLGPAMVFGGAVLVISAVLALMQPRNR